MNMAQLLGIQTLSRERATASVDMQEDVIKVLIKAIKSGVSGDFINKFCEAAGKYAYYGEVPALEKILAKAAAARQDAESFPTQAELDKEEKEYEAAVEKVQAEAKAKLN